MWETNIVIFREFLVIHELIPHIDKLLGRKESQKDFLLSVVLDLNL
jgi:hypothetical protein